MQIEVFKDPNQDYGWTEQTYTVPSPSRKGIQWKASALNGFQRLDRRSPSGQPVTIVVPALYNCKPAEVLALGWLNEIDFLASIRNRFMMAARQTGWDVFTFHTRHNLDPYFDSAINAVRETWLHEGALNAAAVAQTRKRFGPAYDYHRTEPRLVENLLIQSALMDWLTTRAAGRPLRFHLIGTALLSGLVWSGALPLEKAIRTASHMGMCWDGSLNAMAEDEMRHAGMSSDSSPSNSRDQLGWRRFQRVRYVVEGKASLSLSTLTDVLPQLNGLARPFWYSATAKDEPVRIETIDDARAAMETMNLESWSPDVPKPIVDPRTPSRRATDRVRGWLVSPMHSLASTCRWSVYNYLLGTPEASQLFLKHFALAGPVTASPSDAYLSECKDLRNSV